MKVYSRSQRRLTEGSRVDETRVRGSRVHWVHGYRVHGYHLQNRQEYSLAEYSLAEYSLAECSLAGSYLAEVRSTRLASGRRPCAVLIERDPEVLRILSQCLSNQFDVQVASSAPSAAALLQQLAHVDLAFLELDLPAGAGEELLQHLARWPDAVRVLIAQHGSPRVLPRNRHLAHLVLAKPVSLAVVQALARATLALPRD